jgi:hypothetical protein
MQVTVKFTDGEELRGTSEAFTLAKVGFPVTPEEGTNNSMAWISLAAIKYVAVHLPNVESYAEEPREAQGLQKVVLRFIDGTIVRTYRDEVFGPEGEGFNARIWDPVTGHLVKVLVPLLSLKAVFFVKSWDSRMDNVIELDEVQRPERLEQGWAAAS